jgi:hypothetical protein
MGKLHEILAAEKPAMEQAAQLVKGTKEKFGKVDTYFQGYQRTVKMVAASDETLQLQNAAIEAAGRASKELTTTVQEELAWMFQHWATAEDLRYQKNCSNQRAVGDVMWRGQTFLANVPVEELLGLETRVAQLREVIQLMPTLDSSTKWEAASIRGMKGAVKTAEPDQVAKTEKVYVPLELSPATKEHKAQVEKISVERVVGTFTTTKFSGAATSEQKAYTLSIIDELLQEVRKARTRANSVEASTGKIAASIVELILSPFTGATTVNEVTINAKPAEAVA